MHISTINKHKNIINYNNERTFRNELDSAPAYLCRRFNKRLEMEVNKQIKIAASLQRILYAVFVLFLILFIGSLISSRNSAKGGSLELAMQQPNTAAVLWDPAGYDFEKGNAAILKKYGEMEKQVLKEDAGACSSWRNGSFHGRNLDWYQADYGCLIIQMPKGNGVKHASVSLVNSNKTVTQEFIKAGKISEELKSILPCTAVDGINDAGVVININIVPHQPGDGFIGEEGDLSSQCVVRYVLDNAGSADEAVELLAKKKVRQAIVNIAGDQTHYMISDKDRTAVVEFVRGEMKVTWFDKINDGWYSQNSNPAIMTNFYVCMGEQLAVGSDDFYNSHPTAMGVERWSTIKDQYPAAATDVDANLAIAKSVWYFRNIMADKKIWLSENAVAGSGYGKDGDGWYYMTEEGRIPCDDVKTAQQGYWDATMDAYWARYEKDYGSLSDPHVEGNDFWETSHTVIYDIENKVGYLYPFENAYSADGTPVVLRLPE